MTCLQKRFVGVFRQASDSSFTRVLWPMSSPTRLHGRDLRFLNENAGSVLSLNPSTHFLPRALRFARCFLLIAVEPSQAPMPNRTSSPALVSKQTRFRETPLVRLHWCQLSRLTRGAGRTQGARHAGLQPCHIAPAKQRQVLAVVSDRCAQGCGALASGGAARGGLRRALKRVAQ